MADLTCSHKQGTSRYKKPGLLRQPSSVSRIGHSEWLRQATAVLQKPSVSHMDIQLDYSNARLGGVWSSVAVSDVSHLSFAIGIQLHGPARIRLFLPGPGPMVSHSSPPNSGGFSSVVQQSFCHYGHIGFPRRLYVHFSSLPIRKISTNPAISNNGPVPGQGRITLGLTCAGRRQDARVMVESVGTPDMGINIWGESPL